MSTKSLIRQRFKIGHAILQMKCHLKLRLLSLLRFFSITRLYYKWIYLVVVIEVVSIVSSLTRWWDGRINSPRALQQRIPDANRSWSFHRRGLEGRNSSWFSIRARASEVSWRVAVRRCSGWVESLGWSVECLGWRIKRIGWLVESLIQLINHLTILTEINELCHEQSNEQSQLN